MRKTFGKQILFPIFTVLSLSVLFTEQVSAIESIIPSSYISTVGKSYIDITGKQLTDGLTGITNQWGNQWVGWDVINPVIDFKFDKTVQFNQVLIGFNRYELYGIFLPKTVKINGKVFTLKGTEVKDVSRGFVKFNVPFNGTDLNISLEDNNPNRWIFVDEIQFTSPTIQGTVTWQTVHTVTCQNVTQNMTIVIPKTKSSGWDCEKAGLLINHGDEINVNIKGTKY